MPGTDNAPTAADTLRWPSGASWHLGLAGDLCGPGRGQKIAAGNVNFQAPKHAKNCFQRLPVEPLGLRSSMGERVPDLNHLSHVTQPATNQINAKTCH